MNQNEFLLQNLEIDPSVYKNAYAFVDYGNVTKWYNKDRGTFQGRILNKRDEVHVHIGNLGNFLDLFCTKKFFYYGVLPRDKASFHIQTLANKARFKPKSKDVHYIKIYLEEEQIPTMFTDEQIAMLPVDQKGTYVKLPKCNFDVEITMDIMRFMNKYDTLVIMSCDRDFMPLINYVRQMGKKTIIIHSGPTSSSLKNSAHLNINAQRIKEKIGFIKHK